MKPKIVVIVDSREQKPLEFDLSKLGGVRIDGLPVGDYWVEIDGEEAPIAFERKALGDLFSTMTLGYERFKREIEKAKEFGITLILVIEGTMREVAKGYEHSQFSGDSMLKKLAMLRVRYDLEFHFFGDRREMARYIEEIFLAVARNWKKKTGGTTDELHERTGD